jgi:DnaJ-class molecular chaperone
MTTDDLRTQDLDEPARTCRSCGGRGFESWGFACVKCRDCQGTGYEPEAEDKEEQ